MRNYAFAGGKILGSIFFFFPRRESWVTPAVVLVRIQNASASRREEEKKNLTSPEGDPGRKKSKERR